MLLNAFRRLFSNSQNRKARRASGSPRLELLNLEGRIVPATFTVINTGDAGVGSLRDAIDKANNEILNPGADTIVFAASLTAGGAATINLSTSGDNTSGASAFGIISAITITGPTGANGITLNNTFVNQRLFYVSSAGNLTLDSLKLSGGNAAQGNGVLGNGGGIVNAGGSLNISNSTISGNTAAASGGGIWSVGTLNVTNSTISGNTATGGSGGGIANLNTLTVSNSTISGNTATTTFGGGISNYSGSTVLTVTNSTISGNTATNGSGGGISTIGGTITLSNSTLSGNTANLGGGIFNSGGTGTVSNSTISGNSASNKGGGILNGNYATLTLTNSTISGNTATNGSGGGIYNSSIYVGQGGTYPGGILNIANTIIANSISGGDYAGGGTVNVISSGNGSDPTVPANNIVTQATSSATNLWAQSVTSAQLNLGPLQNNGGPSQTIALLTGSVAINAGNATINNASPILGKDQRGISRITSDIGAYSFGIQVTTTADTVNPTDNVTSLREAITLANTTPGNDQISFNLTGASTYIITLDATLGALPTIVDASTAITGGTGGTAGTVTITGLGASSLTIDANKGNFRIFTINTGGNLSISGVTVSGANTSGNGGGIRNSGALTLTNSTISGNTANLGGGIFNSGAGTSTVSNSTISGNTATKGAGGGIVNAGSLTVSNSTISANLGGGIGNDGTATVTNSTISGNTANLGAGIYNYYGTLNIANTIIANNTPNSTSGGDYAGSGDTVNLINGASAANNLVSQGTFLWATTKTSAEINLGPLQNNGGPTQTIALLTGSVAINAGNATISNAAPVNGLDQRGVTRSSTAPSIGAYEAAATVAPGAPTNVTGTAGNASVSIAFTAPTNNGGSAITDYKYSLDGGTTLVSAGTTTSPFNITGLTNGTQYSITLYAVNSVGNSVASSPASVTPLAPPTSTAPLITGTPTPPSSSGSSTVNLYDAVTGQPTGTAVPFPGFNGAVKVVSGDFNNDGVAELIAGAGFGGGPAIAILNSQTGEVMESFFAFDPAFTGGVFVAVQDTNGDGILDIIASAGPGGGPEVRIFDGSNLNILRSFFAYAEDFSGGVSVASIDFNGDGILDLVTGAGPGGAPHVKVFDGATNAIISQWYAYPASFTGGVFVAVGDIGNDGTFEVVTGAGQGGAPVVAVWDPFTGALLSQFMAYAESFTGGVRVAVNDGNGDGTADIITGAGPGGGPHVKAFSFPDLDLLFEFYSGEQTNPGGVFVS